MNTHVLPEFHPYWSQIGNMLRSDKWVKKKKNSHPCLFL